MAERQAAQAAEPRFQAEELHPCSCPPPVVPSSAPPVAEEPPAEDPAGVVYLLPWEAGQAERQAAQAGDRQAFSQRADLGRSRFAMMGVTLLEHFFFPFSLLLEKIRLLSQLANPARCLQIA